MRHLPTHWGEHSDANALCSLLFRTKFNSCAVCLLLLAAHRMQQGEKVLPVRELSLCLVLLRSRTGELLIKTKKDQ